MDSRYAVRQLPTFELTRCRGQPLAVATPQLCRLQPVLSFSYLTDMCRGPVEGRRPPLRGAASPGGPGGRAPPCWEAVGRRVSAGD